MKELIKAKIYGSDKYPELSAFVSDFFAENPVLGVLNNSRFAIFPGFCDVHVHFREPGFSYKETIKTGSVASAHGGYTDVCTMPNLNPVPDSLEHIKVQQDIIDKDAVIKVHPYASITVGEIGDELVDMDALKDKCIAFSDDGRGVQNRDMMRQAMLKAKSAGKMIVAHCEVNDLLFGGYIHDGDYAKEHNHKGICSESEWGQIERDIALSKETGCKYHVCHISTKESVDLIRKAKAEGVDITCETGPHYLILDDSNLQEHGRFKMNPPLRSKSDKEALIEGVLDGTIDIIATDHAPHGEEEKSRGLALSPFGITGIETAFPLLYTYLVKTGILSLEKLTELLCINPRERFKIPFTNDFVIWDLEEEVVVNKEFFLSKGTATPFENQKLFGKCMLTVCDGKVSYKA
ncbi:MAG: dihydroorotase [Ruminococcus sp.]|nr:dihydroorotase [Ruminococcus sp.]